MTTTELSRGLDAARDATLALVAGLDDRALAAQPHPDLSPIGWHLGHVAFTEAYWLHGKLAGDDQLWKPFVRAWSQGGRSKVARRELPARETLFGYLEAVRERSRECLGRVDPGSSDPLEREGYLAWLVECHEHQHRETMSMVLSLGDAPPLDGPPASPRAAEPLVDDGEAERLSIPGGHFVMGTDAHLAYDNERRLHAVECDDFGLDAHPVTSAAWQRFLDDGGYDDARLWTGAGWRWKEAQGVSAPRGWRLRDGRWMRRRLDGLSPLDGREPVCGVSWFEADAFARWRGARLPTEAEWERAARLYEASAQAQTSAAPAPRPGSGPAPVRGGASADGPTDLLGNVWEWTGSAFSPYPGFEPFPYPGYSQPYFGDHWVLRGGSFATSPVIARPSFRNWYLPHVREVFAGLRCAWDAD